jgi:hypothetical protein
MCSLSLLGSIQMTRGKRNLASLLYKIVKKDLRGLAAGLPRQIDQAYGFSTVQLFYDRAVCAA